MPNSIDKIQKEIDAEPDMEKSVELRIKKQEFEKQLQDIEDEARKNINLRFPLGLFLTEKEMLIEQVSELEKQIKDTMPLELRIKLTREKKDLKGQIKKIEDDEKELQDRGEKIRARQKKGSTFLGAQEMIKEHQEKIEAYSNPFLDVTNGALDLTAALAAFNDQGSNTAQVIGIVTQGIGQMAAQIPQLIASITALTSKETVEAGAEAAGAIASGAKSTSKIPIVGGILAVAQAVALAATLFSTMAQAKKFAVGGIVSGNSFAGDKILSRLNSEEMELNQGQQNRLFNMINSGASGNSGSRDNVQFVLRGTDLTGLINNTQRKRSL
jgi:hypothetical protein